MPSTHTPTYLPTYHTEKAAEKAANGGTPISHLSKESEKVKIIRDIIRSEERRLRAAYPLLNEDWQSTVGLAIYLGKFDPCMSIVCIYVCMHVVALCSMLHHVLYT